jgi:hypothetical protein
MPDDLDHLLDVYSAAADTSLLPAASRIRQRGRHRSLLTAAAAAATVAAVAVGGIWLAPTGPAGVIQADRVVSSSLASVPAYAGADPALSSAGTSSASQSALSPTTVEDCAPLATASGGRAIVDYVDFVQANDKSYLLGTPVTTVGDSDLGTEQFRIRCSLSAFNDRTHQLPPAARNGDAAFLPVGTPVFAVKGWSPQCRLAARRRGAWSIYLAQQPNATTATIDPCALAVPAAGATGSSNRIVDEPATVALDHCGVDDLLARGTRWVVLNPPFTALDPPNTFSGHGQITADNTGLRYTDDKGTTIHFTDGSSTRPRVCG